MPFPLLNTSEVGCIPITRHTRGYTPQVIECKTLSVETKNPPIDKDGGTLHLLQYVLRTANLCLFSEITKLSIQNKPF